jgi:hypothetical protein
MAAEVEWDKFVEEGGCALSQEVAVLTLVFTNTSVRPDAGITIRPLPWIRVLNLLHRGNPPFVPSVATDAWFLFRWKAVPLVFPGLRHVRCTYHNYAVDSNDRQVFCAGALIEILRCERLESIQFPYGRICATTLEIASQISAHKYLRYVDMRMVHLSILAEDPCALARLTVSTLVSNRSIIKIRFPAFDTTTRTFVTRDIGKATNMLIDRFSRERARCKAIMTILCGHSLCKNSPFHVSRFPRDMLKLVVRLLGGYTDTTYMTKPPDKVEVRVYNKRRKVERTDVFKGE